MSVRLARIDIYPIKSLDGVSVSEATVLPSGALAHDRQFALFDDAGKWVNGKRTPLFHRLGAAFDPACESVTLSDRDGGRSETFSLADDRSRLESDLSDRLGLVVTLREDATSGFPDDTAASGPTVIGGETLEEVAEWFQIDREDARRRFRANLTLAGGGPFWEDQLFGAPGEPVTFRIGDILFFGMNPCARCVVPSRDPDSGEQEKGFAKQFADRRREFLPAWAETDAFDHYYRLAVNTRLFAPSLGGVVRVGDPAELVNH